MHWRTNTHKKTHTETHTGLFRVEREPGHFHYLRLAIHENSEEMSKSHKCGVFVKFRLNDVQLPVLTVYL